MENNNEIQFEKQLNLFDSKANIVPESGPQPVQDSCEESDEEWNYMKAKEGQTEKENVLSEEFKENIEPVTEKEFSSVELKEQLDTTPSEPVTNNTCAPIAAPASSEQDVSPVVDDLHTTPDMMIDTDETNFHLNPEAKEFVPTTYSASAPAVNEHDQQNGETNSLQVKQPYRHVFDDVVSQSPRKGRESNMDDFLLPAENDFDVEIANRPHELLVDDVMPEEAAAEIAEPAIELQNENELLIQNALDNVGMKDSLYVENTSSGFNNGEVDLLNTIQPLPTEVELEENNVLSNKEGLSLEIDEKDVISPSSEDTKEIVTEIEEKVQEMHIQESAVEPTLQDFVMEAEILQPEISHPEAEILQPEISHPETEVLQPEISHPETEEVLQLEISHPEAEILEHPQAEILHFEADISQPESEITQSILEISQPIFETSLPDVVMEEIKPAEETKPEEPVVEEKPIEEPKEIVIEEPKEVVENGDINVEELNKKNLEESAKLDAPVKIEESKLLEATLGVVAVTAAATATIKASSAKKSPASKPATLFVAKKPTTTTTSKKPGTTSSVSAAAARPKTAPIRSTTERKPTTTTSRTTTVSAAKPRVDIKKTTTSTLSKPKEVSKTTEIKKTTTTTTSSARPIVSKTSSATQARPRPATATSGLTNGIAKTTTASRITSATSSTLKAASTTSAATPKPRLSPRGTVSSTLRKAETLKSPSATRPAAAPLSSRIDSGLKSARPATCPAKPSTLRATKPAVGTTSTTSNRLTVKTTTTSTTTSQRKTASPLDKKKTLAPATTLTSSARKSISLTKTPTKSPGAKKPPPIQRPVVVDPVVLPPVEVAPEVATAPLAAAVDIPIA